MKKECQTCAFQAVPSGEPPCAGCNYNPRTRDFSNWTPKMANIPNADFGGELRLLPDRAVTVVAGRKDDSGKLDMTLLDDMPRALKAVVEVMQWAITKKQPVPYERGSWQGVHADRYRAAVMRHNRDACEAATYVTSAPARFQKDPETNLLHLAHIATSALMALENTLRELEAEKK